MVNQHYLLSIVTIGAETCEPVTLLWIMAISNRLLDFFEPQALKLLYHGNLFDNRTMQWFELLLSEFHEMSAVTTLKTSHTREKGANKKTDWSRLLVYYKQNSLIARKTFWNLNLSISKALLSLETKLTRIEATNHKLVEALEEAEDIDTAEQFQTTLVNWLMILLVKYHNWKWWKRK